MFEHISRANPIAFGFETPELASHVQLSACSANQTCKEENGRGRFTKALLEVLALNRVDRMTYERLIKRLPHIDEYVRFLFQYSDSIYNINAVLLAKTLAAKGCIAQGFFSTLWRRLRAKIFMLSHKRTMERTNWTLEKRAGSLLVLGSTFTPVQTQALNALGF